MLHIRAGGEHRRWVPTGHDCERGERGASGIRRALVAAVVVAAPLVLLAPRNADASVSVEMRIHELIDADRAEPLTIHYGLQAAAREHSRYMASEGSLNHDNADARVNAAPPDPPEGNGAPDDGFPIAKWCENVTYSIGRTESEAPDQLYAQWKRSGAHYRCLMDTSRNVGAVGIYYDGESWWATFLAEVDETPPGGAKPKPKPAEPKPTPAMNVAPAATTAPDRDADEAPRTSARPSEAPDAREPAVAASAVPSSDPNASQGSAAPSAAPAEQDATARIPVDVDPSVAGADSPFAGTVHRAQRGDRPIGLGWQEVLGVAGVLSVASLLLKKRWVLAPA